MNDLFRTSERRNGSYADLANRLLCFMSGHQKWPFGARVIFLTFERGKSLDDGTQPRHQN